MGRPALLLLAKMSLATLSLALLSLALLSWTSGCSRSEGATRQASEPGEQVPGDNRLRGPNDSPNPSGSGRLRLDPVAPDRTSGLEGGPDVAGLEAPAPTAPAPTQVEGQEIVICGQRISIGTPVVLWGDAGGYDGYSTDKHFDGGYAGGPEAGTLRYQPGRVSPSGDGSVLFPANSTDLNALAEVVDQLVLHYDACGASKVCFRSMHDNRGLSVHFLLDVDGTLYQTVDLREHCWHAGKANFRSIGVEIAHIGGRKQNLVHEMEEWYVRDEVGLRIQFPDWLGNGDVRTVGFVGRPARQQRQVGRIHGERQFMYDMTPEQYQALARLSAGLCQVFPHMQPDAPRGRDGAVLRHALKEKEYQGFGGILGHYHLTANKLDPGVAFDWEPFLGMVRAELGR